MVDDQIPHLLTLKFTYAYTNPHICTHTHINISDSCTQIQMITIDEILSPSEFEISYHGTTM